MSAVNSKQHSAFPALAKTKDGNLLVAWREAGQHNPGPAKGVIKARRMRPNGSPIGAPFTVLTDPKDLRDPGLTVLPDGRLLLQYFKYDAVKLTANHGVWLAISSDNGARWRVIGKVGFRWKSLVASSGQPLVLPDGSWLVAGYGFNRGQAQRSAVVRSVDRGVTWGAPIEIASPPRNKDDVEPVLGLLPDGQTVMALWRRMTPGGFGQEDIYRSISTNGGVTWTPATLAIKDASGKPGWAVTEGAVVCVARAPGGNFVYTSWDDGGNFSAGQKLGPIASKGVYAQLVEVRPGRLAVASAIQESPTRAGVYLSFVVASPRIR